MFGVYLFSAVLGGGLVLFSLLGGSDEAGAGSDIDVDVDGGADEPGSHVHLGGELLLGLFRFRNLTFLLAGFGVTGVLGTWLGVGRIATALLAGTVGVAAMVLVHGVFTWLRRTDSARDVFSDHDLEGAFARVVVPMTATARGRVSCIASGQQLFLTARTAPEYPEQLAVGTPVVILRMQGGVAEVAPAPSLELSSSTD
jgi:hypothetical protein